MQISGNVDYHLGFLYFEKGLHSRAIQALERVPEFDRRAMQAKGLLAECYLRGGRYQDAIDAYATILRVNPNDPRSLMGLGVAYRMTGDLDRSEETLNELLRKHKPPDGRVHIELARTLELKGDTKGAIGAYETASASDLQRRDAYIGLAGIYKRMGDTETALSYLTRLRTMFPNDRSIQMEIDTLRKGQ
jgi:tetratricopeptide (TPR) repeat protein